MSAPQQNGSESYSPEQMLAALPYLSEEEQRRLAQALEDEECDELDRHCAEDPLYWAQNHTKTENPLYLEQGVEFRAPFPQKSYFSVLFRAFREEKLLFVPKTRDMMTSWSAMVWATHRAQWEKAFVIVQTMKETKAIALVNYADSLYRNQDQFLRDRHPLAGQTKTEITWRSGGRILGVPQGEHQVRTYHPTLYIMDEGCFLPEAEACWNAVKASSPDLQMIAISSAGPSWMGDQCAL